MPRPFCAFGFPRRWVDCDVRCETLALAKRWRGIMFAPKWRGTGLGKMSSSGPGARLAALDDGGWGSAYLFVPGLFLEGRARFAFHKGG